MKIAIIGAGISGLSCAWLLDKHYEVTLFEKNDYLGGHANTATIDYPITPPTAYRHRQSSTHSFSCLQTQAINVDTGFIVFNFRTYPNLKALFESLGISIVESTMSFGVKNWDNGLEYSGNSLGALFAQKKNLFNPLFLNMLKDIVRFNKKATQCMEAEDEQRISTQQTLKDLINQLGVGDYFKQYYLLPMAGAIWSCSLEEIKAYPASTFLRFFYNHGLLTINRQPQWYTIKNGSKQYVEKLSHQIKGDIHTNCAILTCKQQGDKILLTDSTDRQFTFDHVIFATHSDQSHHIIQDKNEVERAILGAIKYSTNTAVLHRDSGQMPVHKKAWASWVSLSQTRHQKNKVSLTYWMNQLQDIPSEMPLFVTLNPSQAIEQDAIFATYNYQHPIFDHRAIWAQQNLHRIQGKRQIWFCGAWTKYGFHEDGLNSAIAIAKQFNVPIPWQT